MSKNFPFRHVSKFKKSKTHKLFLSLVPKSLVLKVCWSVKNYLKKIDDDSNNIKISFFKREKSHDKEFVNVYISVKFNSELIESGLKCFLKKNIYI